MTRRVLGGMVTAVVLALGLVGSVPRPALAQDAPAVSITSPSGTVTGAVTIKGTASMGRSSSSVDNVTATLSATQADHPLPQTTFSVNGDGQASTLPFSFGAAVPYNGIYKVVATATGTEHPIDFNGQESAQSPTVTFAVEVAPNTPSGFRATVSETRRTVSLAWDANDEPDLIGYAVVRTDKSGPKTIYVGTNRTYTDVLGTLPAGTYKYDLYAARTNADGSSYVSSAPSTKSAVVKSSPPPNATTTTTAPGSTPTPPRGGSASTNTGPALASHGKTDLSGFAALLPQGGQKLPSAPRTSAQLPDSGFDEQLPFDAQQQGAKPGARSDSGSVEALGGQRLASSGGESRPTSLLFLAAGLLATVVLMHLLWLRDEVNREPRPAVSPEEPPTP